MSPADLVQVWEPESSGGAASVEALWVRMTPPGVLDALVLPAAVSPANGAPAELVRRLVAGSGGRVRGLGGGPECEEPYGSPEFEVPEFEVVEAADDQGDRAVVVRARRQQ